MISWSSCNLVMVLLGCKGRYIQQLLNVMRNPFSASPHKMIKHTQAIRRQQPTNCLRVFDHFVVLALKGLIKTYKRKRYLKNLSPLLQ